MTPQGTSQAPPIEYPNQVEYPNLVMLDGQVYTLERVACSFKEAVAAHHSFYEGQFNTYKEQQDQRMLEVLQNDSERQLQRLVEARQRGTTTVPASQFNMPIKVIDGQIWELRQVLYEPEEIKTSQDYLRQYCWDGLNAMHREMIVGLGSRNLTIVVKCPFKALIEFAYSEANNMISTDEKTYHSLSDNRLCTGDVDARQVWRNTNEGQFVTYINRINMFSMGRAEIRIMNLMTRTTEMCHIKHVVCSNTIVSINPEERSSWTAR